MSGLDFSVGQFALLKGGTSRRTSMMSDPTAVIMMDEGMRSANNMISQGRAQEKQMSAEQEKQRKAEGLM